MTSTFAVEYYCPCTPLTNSSSGSAEAGGSDPASTEPPVPGSAGTTPGLSAVTSPSVGPEVAEERSAPFEPRSKQLAFNAHPLSHLLYCEECHAVRCNRCTISEIAAYYCTSCLFETPSASVLTEKNRCSRNCFECPVCKQTLLVLGDAPSTAAAAATAATAASASVSESEDSDVKPYYLSCAACRWDSREVGVAFRKPTGLSMQLQKRDDDADDVQEFDNLRTFFENAFKNNSNASATGGSSTTASGSSAFAALAARRSTLAGRSLTSSLPSSYGIGGRGRNSRGTSSSASTAAASNKTGDILPPYTAKRNQQEDHDMVGELMSITSLDQVTSYEQRTASDPNKHSYRLSSLFPQRVPLKTKVVKRCRQCSQILIRPEPKVQSTRFKIRQCAISSLPNITLARTPKEGSVPSFKVDQETTLYLRFSNPLHYSMSIALAVPSADENGSNAIVIDDEDGVGSSAYSECLARVVIPVPEFDVSAGGDLWTLDEASSPSISSSSLAGSIIRSGNTTQVAVKVTPSEAGGPLRVPLHVSASSTDTSPVDGGDPESKCDEFWVYITLGTVAPA
ncbi:dynactin p62 [Ramicandelaber brevisporus]|nr:dynactin p62 [Ramicandelaber brevisporus]